MEREIKRVMKSTAHHLPSLAGPETFSFGSNQEWRDWSRLQSDVVRLIGKLLLSNDVAHYILFRQTCTEWRKCTDNPSEKDTLYYYYCPKNWLPMKCFPRAKPPSPELKHGFRFLNIRTRRCIWVNIPELHSGFLVIYMVSGCLLLFNPTNGGIFLLNPLTRFLIELPPLKSLKKAMKKTYLNVKKVTAVILLPSSTVVLFFSSLNKIVYAKPGEQHWVPFGTDISCFSALLFKDRLFVVTAEGDLLQLEPNSHNEVRTLIPQYWSRGKHFLVECAGQMFVVNYLYGSSGILEIQKLDLRNMRLIRTSVPAGYTMVLSESQERARCIAISTTIFPCMRRDCIYHEYKDSGGRSRYYEGRVRIYMSKSRPSQTPVPPLQYWAMVSLSYGRTTSDLCEHNTNEYCLADNLMSYCRNSVMHYPWVM